MKFSKGNTRFVVLTKTKAYKIARIRPVAFLGRIFMLCLNSTEKRKKFTQKYGSFPLCVWKYVMAGMYANLNECIYSSSFCDDRRVMHTQRLYHGLIVVQDRGTPVTDKELQEENPFYPVLPVCVGTEGSQTFLQTRQFVRNENGSIVLVDYGYQQTCSVLRETYQPISG
jgi:hypothetical protein